MVLPPLSGSNWRMVVAMLALCAAGAARAQAPLSMPEAAADPTSTQSVPTEAAVRSDKPLPARETLRLREQELNALRAEQRKASAAERDLATESDSISDERRALNQSLIETATRIRKAEERSTAAENRLHLLDVREGELHAALDGRQAVIAEVLAVLQRIGHRPPPLVIAGVGDATAQVRAALSLGAVLPQLRGEADKVLAELTGLAEIKKERTAESALLEGELAQLAEAQLHLSRLVDERQQRQAEIELAIGNERLRVAALSRQATTLQELIAKLEQGLDGTARAGRALPGKETKAGETLGRLAALHDPARLAPAHPFVAAKGKLSFPANGIAVRHFGGPDGLGGNEKGLSLATRAGAQVVAPADGWVVYAARYRSYGQLLILNVGGGYHVVLAGMERIMVDLGQFVLTGEPVAVMGNGTQVASTSLAGSPTGSSQPVLYVEFRKDGTPVDSSPWWTATENEKVRG
jgi:murein hydrolase activator